MDLVSLFADATAKQTDAIWEGGDPGDKHGTRRIAAWKKLRAMGDVGRDALATLLNHKRPDVRVMAAAYLLRHRTAEAMAVLREVAQEVNFTAFGAQQALERWE